MATLNGKSVLITGGGSGIGRGVAQHFVQRGAKVVITGRREAKLQETCNAISGDITYFTGDVTDDEHRKAMIEKAVVYGGKLDALISNAGNMYRGNIDELEESKLIEIFNSNVISGMLLLGKAKQYLKETEGVNIFIGSVHNRRAFPGASPYAATKGALETLTKVLAAELGKDKIRVNCVVPGAIFTEINQRAGLFDDDQAKKRLDSMAKIHALGEIGIPEDIAEAVEYLISARWTTGAILDVDGGLGLGLTED